MGEQERLGTKKHAHILPTTVILPLPDDALREADRILFIGSYRKERRNCELINKHRTVAFTDHNNRIVNGYLQARGQT